MLIFRLERVLYSKLNIVCILAFFIQGQLYHAYIMLYLYSVSAILNKLKRRQPRRQWCCCCLDLLYLFAIILFAVQWTQCFLPVGWVGLGWVGSLTQWAQKYKLSHAVKTSRHFDVNVAILNYISWIWAGSIRELGGVEVGSNPPNSY